MKANFRRYYDDDFEQFTEPGNRYEDEYQLYYDENGAEALKVVGQRDNVAEINSHAAEVDIDLIFEQFTDGDYSALDRRQGFYADVSGLPESFSEAMNINIRGKQIFDELPKEAREIYGNNYLSFIADPSKLATVGSADNIDTGDAGHVDVKIGDGGNAVDEGEVNNNVES